MGECPSTKLSSNPKGLLVFNVVGIFPNEQSIIRLIAAVLMEQNDDWQTQHRYMQVKAMAELMNPNPTSYAISQAVPIPPKAA